MPLSLEDSVEILEEFRKSVYYIQDTHEIYIQVTVTIGVCLASFMRMEKDEAGNTAYHAPLRGKAKGKDRITLAIDEDMN